MASKRSDVLTVAEAYRSYEEARDRLASFYGPIASGGARPRYRRVRMNARSLQDLARDVGWPQIQLGTEHWNALFGVPVEIDEGLGDGVLEWDMP